jgi:2-aminoadipate transaminase
MNNAQTLRTLAKRADKMNPSVIREILKVTEGADIISFASGLPSTADSTGRYNTLNSA